MSRVFKSSNVNIGDPFKVTLSEEAINMSRKKAAEERSSDVRSNDPSTTASNIIFQANEEANQIIEEASAKARKTIEDAVGEAEVEKKNVIKKGYDEGYQAGLIEGKRETEDLAQQALEIKQELEEEKENLLKNLESKLPEIIISGVKKIIGEELTTNKQIIVNIVSDALKKISSTEATVRISKDDFEILEANKNLVLSKNKEITDLEIKEDLSLNKGDCIIETSSGDVDASIDTQINKLDELISGIAGEKNVNQ